MPHNHQMWAVIGIYIGIYTGREDNIFWRRVPGGHGGKLQMELQDQAEAVAEIVAVIVRGILNRTGTPRRPIQPQLAPPAACQSWGLASGVYS